MAITQADDLTQLEAMDADGVPVNFAFDGGVFKSGQVSAEGNIEGTNCIEIRVNSTGQGDMGVDFNATITALGDGHLWAWFRESFEYDTFAANGVVMGIASDLNGPPTDFGSWNVSGADRSISCYDGWVRVVVNPFLGFDITGGTPPLRTSFTHGHLRMQMEASGRDVAMFDSYDMGIGTNTITGGTAAANGKFSEIVTADRAAARGFWKDKIGIFYTNCNTIFGDTGTAESNITETNQTVIFEYNRVQGHIQEITCVGNATSSANVVSFGTITGTGVDEVGSAGVSFINAGVVPQHFRADDANLNTMVLAGCSFLGPAAVYEDAVMSCWVNTTDETVDINDAGVQDVLLTTPIGDFIAFGHAAPFDAITIVAGTVATGGVYVWEYSTGVSTWANLVDLTDGTSNFTTAGTNSVTYSMPTDWVEGTLSTVSRFYIRARSTTGPSTQANLTQATLRFTGRIRLEQTNVQCVSTNFTNMGTITVNSGADLKKCLIADSLAPAKNAAVDFGSVDPTADTVRDLVITGGVNAINLQGSGNTTYNLRNIVMSGQSGKKIRVEFGGSDTVTINVVDGGDNLVAGDIDNVNSSTVVINNATVTTLVNVKDHNAANLINARVILEAADGAGDLTFEDVVTITRVSSTASVAHTAHGMVNGNKVVIRGADQQEYNGVFSISNVSANAYDYTVSGTPTTPATGTITESGVMLEGLTDASGNISDTRTVTLDTVLKGFARKATASPRYKSFTLAGTTDNADGQTINVRLILDE